MSFAVAFEIGIHDAGFDDAEDDLVGGKWIGQVPTRTKIIRRSGLRWSN